MIATSASRFTLCGALTVLATLPAAGAAQSTVAASAAQPAVPPAAEQVASALQAAPADRREGATVLGYDAAGKLVRLREGTNDLICLADNPAEEGWSVACYHESLEPFMSRGRELRQQGVGGAEVNETRFREIEEGTLPFPREAPTLHVLHGEGWDADAGEVRAPYLRWVIYTPFATAESTGLSTAATDQGPWLMFPGTAGAHIMITPPRPGG